MNIVTKLHHSKSPALRGITGAALLTLGLAGGYAVAAHKTVTLTVDGTSTTVTTMRSTVADIISENGFTLGERDDLTVDQHVATADATVGDHGTIELRRSRPVQISLDGRVTEQQWTTAATVDGALAQLNPMTEQARKLERFFGASAFETELDAAGRIMVPAKVMEHAGLRKDVVVTGVRRCLELWDRETWSSVDAELSADVPALAEALGQA